MRCSAAARRSRVLRRSASPRLSSAASSGTKFARLMPSAPATCEGAQAGILPQHEQHAELRGRQRERGEAAVEILEHGELGPAQRVAEQARQHAEIDRVIGIRLAHGAQHWRARDARRPPIGRERGFEPHPGRHHRRRTGRAHARPSARAAPASKRDPRGALAGLCRAAHPRRRAGARRDRPAGEHRARRADEARGICRIAASGCCSAGGCTRSISWSSPAGTSPSMASTRW